MGDFDLEAAQTAIAAFLKASGLDPADPALSDTPRLVAEAWRDDLLDGYRADPAEILSESFEVESPGQVVLTGMKFHSMCPHHLLPYEGTITIGYVPGDRVVGLGRLPRLVDAFAHRLILQEELAGSLADALMEHLSARGAAVQVRARQGCMMHRGPRREAEVISSAWRGVYEKEEAARMELLSAAGEPS